MGATMSRAGRKRKANAPRKAAGQIDWYAEREDAALLTKWHRARDAFLEGIGGDRRMASQAGKLFCQRRLSALELEAIDRWCEKLVAYDRIVLGMARSAHPTALERAGVSLRADLDPERIQQLSRALRRGAGRGADGWPASATAISTACAATRRRCRRYRRRARAWRHSLRIGT